MTTTNTTIRPTQRTWDRARALSMMAMQQALRDAGYEPDAGLVRLMALQIVQSDMEQAQRVAVAIAVRQAVDEAGLNLG